MISEAEIQQLQQNLGAASAVYLRHGERGDTVLSEGETQAILAGLDCLLVGGGEAARVDTEGAEDPGASSGEDDDGRKTSASAG